MATHRIDRSIIGKTKGVITVLDILPFTKGKRSIIKISCECGNVREIEARYFKKRDHTRCSCYQSWTAEYQSHPLYEVWRGMKARCFNPNHVSYKNYGGRGIRVCRRWLIFENFYNDVISGYAPGLTLDRINGDGDYTPDNFQWLTPADNSRKSRWVKLGWQQAAEIRKSPLNGKQLAIIYGVSDQAIYSIRNNKSWVA